VRGRALLLAAATLALVPSAADAKLPPTRDILTVGNNWEGTADCCTSRGRASPT
jgi:hypothetical protein